MLTYIDSSVALAYLLAEIRMPAAEFWRSVLTSSRLLQYEVWNPFKPVSSIGRDTMRRAHSLRVCN